MRNYKKEWEKLHSNIIEIDKQLEISNGEKHALLGDSRQDLQEDAVVIAKTFINEILYADDLQLKNLEKVTPSLDIMQYSSFPFSEKKLSL